ncbi:major facilitator family transporter [gamma proteobacterium NOR5-3]|nr:major facilitator family transporter [gamma proteobacterium NOR5-3]
MNEFTHGWKPLIAATVGTMCGIFTLTNYSQGFFVGPVTAEFGWSPPQFFLSYTVMMCLGLVTGPAVGTLVRSYGLKAVGIFGLFGHSLAYVLLSFNTGSLVLWYLSWALLAILGAGSLPIVWTTVLNGWFEKHRGKAIGITMTGTGLGAFLLPPLVEFLISNHGWRAAYRAIGLGAMCISLPIVFAMFRENTDTAAHASGTKTPSKSWGMTRSEAMRTGRFWLLGAVLFLTVVVIAGVLSNFPRIMGELGFDRSAIAGIAAVMGITVVFGRLFVGILVDKFWAPGVAAAFFVLPTIALLLALKGDLSTSTAMIMAVLIGLAAGAELDLLAFLTGRFFGPNHYPEIFGAIIAFFTVGAGIAPPLFGAVAQATGGYSTMLTIAVGMLIACIAMFLALGRYPEIAGGPD